LPFQKNVAAGSRRRFLSLAGGGIAFGLASLLVGRVEAADVFDVLKSGQRLDIHGNGKKIIEEAYRIGYEHEKRHGGCAQCTIAALQDSIEFIPVNKDVFRAGSCLDGGATPMGVQNCGSFTGAGIVIGYLCGRKRDRFSGHADVSHRLIRRVYEKFKGDYGSVLCKDVRKKMEPFVDKCPRVVGKTSAWAAEAILSEFTTYG
jgi:C_GCAxxG_C_C family probable redox protein